LHYRFISGKTPPNFSPSAHKPFLNAKLDLQNAPNATSFAPQNFFTVTSALFCIEANTRLTSREIFHYNATQTVNQELVFTR